jgi:metal-sulfur cluster biosynthetic enzyme
MRQRPVDPIAASAFGLEAPSPEHPLADERTQAAARQGPLELISSPLRAESVVELLYDVIDPELGVNIVDLGLLRGVEVGEDGAVRIDMTLTTPGCPLGGYIDDEIRSCLTQLPQVREVSVNVGFEPPWDPTQMTDSGREQLGWA